MASFRTLELEVKKGFSIISIAEIISAKGRSEFECQHEANVDLGKGEGEFQHAEAKPASSR